ncbi:unnamed protein product, partial [Mesorhabditis spiculigera]
MALVLFCVIMTIPPPRNVHFGGKNCECLRNPEEPVKVPEPEKLKDEFKVLFEAMAANVRLSLLVSYVFIVFLYWAARL